MAPLIRTALVTDAPLILRFIRVLAAYENLSHELEATGKKPRAALCPVDAHPAAERALAFDGTTPAGFAIFLVNHSTFQARPNLYLEDLFVPAELHGRGIGPAFRHLARITGRRAEPLSLSDLCPT